MGREGKLSKTNKLLLVITEDWYFWSHRLPIAQAARENGFEVIIATRVNDHGNLIEQEGFRLIPISLKRKSRNVFHELMAVIELAAIYLREKPAIIHHVAMKPVLYGTIAARLTGAPFVVNALAGLGHIFTAKNLKTSIIRNVVRVALRMILNTRRTAVILQNTDDVEKLMRECGLNQEIITLIRGSGVNLKQFSPSPAPDDGVPIVILPSRMLWEKGIKEFVEAAAILGNEGIRARFVLCGRVDPDSPSTITAAQLRKWQEEGTIEWWGHNDDMPAVYARAHIVSLPTFYGEGVPKALIEAAACGRPIVATNVPGCREVVRHGENGLLVPAHDPHELANALRLLITNPELRDKMGGRGREIAEEEFAEEKVVSATMGIYRKFTAL